MAWEENSCICLHMQLIAILSRIGVRNFNNAKKSCFTMKKQDFLVSLYPYNNTPERIRDNVSGVICR